MWGFVMNELPIYGGLQEQGKLLYDTVECGVGQPKFLEDFTVKLHH